jgi:hypothetical protein
MKKTSKQQIPHPLSILKQPNIPTFAFTGVDEILRQQRIENKESRETIIICPNCEFHFKVELKQGGDNSSGDEVYCKDKDLYRTFSWLKFSFIQNSSC